MFLAENLRNKVRENVVNIFWNYFLFSDYVVSAVVETFSLHYLYCCTHNICMYTFSTYTYMFTNTHIHIHTFTDVIKCGSLVVICYMMISTKMTYRDADWQYICLYQYEPIRKCNLRTPSESM